ncbi:MAG TPA: cytochrome P460 family protein, partial [Puia sp.]|nr:cytochrome P460 family protein [Puia sp.]
WHDQADFANWKAISTTERFDNGTMRLILANAIAEQAIREGHTNPWPRGAEFAKVAWDQLVDSAGEIHTGAFKQVEFMIRDDDKYGATDGWGFARWVGGLALKPYGKSGDFATECTNCHQTMAANDHVFTFPLADTLAVTYAAASPADSFAGHPMTGKVITSFADPRLGTMSTLYGNDVAVKSARSGQAYPAGAVVTLVTWSQRQDPHWFGGRIPDSLKSIERVSFKVDGTPEYKCWQDGRSAAIQPLLGANALRIAYITGRKASVMP